MDETLTQEWNKVNTMVEERFGEVLDEQTILFLIGLQELGISNKVFKKEEKVDIIHIGLCTVLSPLGFYQKIGNDDDGWPHFKNIKKLPDTTKGENESALLKKAIIDYFKL
jgi:hypothetical protein